ncbi:uncharacterized protein LOC130448093 [Diorhabda sublineata]|uniref:uncharacterized protein LOC130448093 n=1 Tax=Diorhabda sublineata TaxID=1163346 RepID=UPI0024E159C7|nr:uncharacterized protein LOC130448093 [Diorhabda sublineata]
MEILTPADFVNEFHNLNGVVISERKKNFFILLNRASQNFSSDDVDSAIKNLQPTTYQEKLFFVKTLIYFKKIEPLLEVLKKCNREHIKMVVKQKWFIQEAFRDITSASLVNEFFPWVSYSTCLKLLGRIPNYWTEEKNDELFDYIQKRYGFSYALKILHTCSSSKIETHLKEESPLLTTNQLISLLNRNEELFKLYINQRYSVNNPYVDQKVLNILANKSVDLLLELMDNKLIDLKILSTSASVRLLNISKQKLYEDPNFFKIFNIRSLVKHLGSDFKTFLQHKFSQNIDKFTSQSIYSNLFKRYPKSSRWSLFIEVYHKVYNKNIEEFLKTTDTFVITLNPDKKTISQWAGYKYESTKEDIYLKYFPPLASIPIIKGKIDVTSDARKREEMIKLLISSCAVNGDLESLDEVLEYINERHKNEDPNAHRRLVEFFLNEFKTIGFTKNQLDFVHEQIIFIKTQGLIDFFYYEHFFVVILKYSYENHKDLFNKLLLEYLRDLYTSKIWYYGNNQIHFGEFKREILIEMCKIFPQVVVSKNDYFLEFTRIFVEIIVQLSTINILEYPVFVSAIQEACNKSDLSYNDVILVSLGIQYNTNFPRLTFLDETTIFNYLSLVNKREQFVFFKDFFKRIVTKGQLTELELKIVSFVLENVDTSVVGNLEPILKNYPLLLLPNIEKNWKNINLDYLIKIIKHYTHIGMDRILCDYLINNWLEADLPTQKDAVKILLKLLPEEDFIKFFEKNINVLTSVPDLTTEEIKSHKIQCQLAGDFKNVSEPLKYLPLLQKYCTQDYIKFALPSLYSFFSRLAEKNIYSYIEFLIQDVLLKKYIIYFSCQFLKIDFVINLLRNVVPDDYNVLNTLCIVTLIYFINTRDEELFKLFIKYVTMIDIYDKKLFAKLIKRAPPKMFISEYIEVCWRKIEDINTDDDKVNKLLDNLLKHTFDKNVITRLTTSFITDIISRYLPIESVDRLSNIQKFTILCLIYRESEKSSNYKLTFDILSRLKMKSINNFCQTAIDLYYTNVDSEFIDDFIKHWVEKFSLAETLNEHITLKLFRKFLNPIDETKAENIINYLNELIDELGMHIFEIFIDNLRKYLNDLNEVSKYNLLYLMLGYKMSAITCVLVLKLLKPVDQGLSEDAKPIHAKIMEKIKTFEEPIVTAYYEMYLHNLH